MTAREEIQATAAGLRAAVGAQAYAESDRLLAEYCRQVEAVLRAEPAAAGNSRLAADSTVLFRWMRRTILADAAQDASRLAHLPPRNAYNSAAQTQTWRVDG